MTRMPSIVGIAVELSNNQTSCRVGSLNEVRAWADAIKREGVSIQIREIGQIVMFIEGEKP